MSASGAKGRELVRRAAPPAKGSGELSKMCIWKTSMAKDLNRKRERWRVLKKRKRRNGLYDKYRKCPSGRK